MVQCETILHYVFLKKIFIHFIFTNTKITYSSRPISRNQTLFRQHDIQSKRRQTYKTFNIFTKISPLKIEFITETSTEAEFDTDHRNGERGGVGICKAFNNPTQYKLSA